MAEDKVFHWTVDDDDNPHPDGIHFHGYGTEAVLLENLKQHFSNPAIVAQENGSLLIFKDASLKRAKKNAIGKAEEHK
jgi:hypothetical protein